MKFTTLFAVTVVFALFACDPPQTCSTCSTGGGSGSTGGGSGATGGGSGGGGGCRQITTVTTPAQNELLLPELPPGKAASIAAQLAGARRADAYDLAMQLSRG